MKLAERLIALTEKQKIDFADVESGLLKDLSKVDASAAREVDKKWGMDQVWGISASIRGGMGGADPDHLELFDDIVSVFGEKNREKVKAAILNWDYSYDDLKDGTQPW